jgi:hypothetical protein
LCNDVEHGIEIAIGVAAGQRRGMNVADEPGKSTKASCIVGHDVDPVTGEAEGRYRFARRKAGTLA